MSPETCSMEIILAIAILLVSLLIFTQLKAKYNRQAPGPWGLPVLGHMHLLGTRPWQTLLKWRKIYGPIVSIKFGNMPAIAISDAQLIREALSLKEFSGRPAIRFMNILGRKSVVRGDDIGTLEQRKFFHSALNSKGLKSTVEDRITKEVIPILEKIESTKGSPLQMTGFFQIYIFNVIWEILLGERKSHDDPEMLLLLRNLSSAQELPTKWEMIAIFNSFLDFLLSEKRKKIIRDGMKHLIKTFNAHNLTWVPGQPRDLTDLFLDKKEGITKGSGKFQNDAEEYYVGSAYDSFIGGYDSTSISLEWLCLYLTKFPEIRRKFQDEIDSKIGLDRTPNLSDESNMPYAQAVINETLRRSSIGPLGLFHEAMQDVEFKGFFIPKNTMIVGNLYAANYDEGIWGDPNVFRPERFLDFEGNPIREKEVMAFSTGRRSCIGERLARNHLFLFSTSIFQQFDTEFAGIEPSLEGLVGVLTKPQPFALRFIKRNLN